MIIGRFTYPSTYLKVYRCTHASLPQGLALWLWSTVGRGGGLFQLDTFKILLNLGGILQKAYANFDFTSANTNLF